MKPAFECKSVYHVYNRANGKENLFKTDENFRYFLKKYTDYIFPVAETLAYCLMPNHFHLLVRIRSEENLFDHYNHLIKEKKQKPKVINGNGEYDFHKFVLLQFQHFLNGYAQAYNKMYKRKGRLFLEHIKLKPVLDEIYYGRLIHYIHYNPVNHGFCKYPRDWTFSSYHAFLTSKESKIAKDEVLDWFGGRTGFLEFHENMPDRSFDF